MKPRLSLRQLMAAISIICIVTSYVVWDFRNAEISWRVEQDLLEELPHPHHGYGAVSNASARYWRISGWIRPRYFERVSNFSYEYEYGQNDFDRHLSLIARFKQLQSLRFEEPIVSDGNCGLLLPLKRQLTVLEIPGSSLSDASAAELSQFSHLTRLDISQTELSDDGVRQVVKNLPQLEELYLEGLPLSRSTFEEIARLPNLIELSVYDSKFSLLDLNALKHSPNLQRIDVAREAAAASDPKLLDSEVAKRITYWPLE